MVLALLAISGAGSANAVPAGKKVLPFVDDDYPKALTEARAKKLPLFIEAGAPW
jgi:hypothetical protein